MQSDHYRFNSILKRGIKSNLKDYLGETDLFGKHGGKTVTIPVPHIEIPHFRFGENGGVGQGDGDEGDSLGSDPRGQGDGRGKAGSGEGDHILEAEVTIDELAEMLGKELGLPDIEPKGEDKIISERYKVRGVSNVGPETLRHFKRGYQRALKRQISEGTYDPLRPLVIPNRDDMRYKALERVPSPQSNAVLIYMMDVSGSMGEEQKRLVRNTTFWLSAWIQHFYKGVEERFIIHDSKAKEVDRHTFFHTRESGGTEFVPVYNLCMDIIAREYDPSAYNIYPFHFTDGDNFSNEDTGKSLKILEDHILPAVNMFGYGQCLVNGQGEGRFLQELKKYFKLEDTSAKVGSKVRAAKLYKNEDIGEVLKHFLRTGR